MAHQLLMPKLGLTMTEGTISEWKAKPGDQVKVGDVVFVVETDKVAYDVAAEHDGVLLEILVPMGTTAPVGMAVGRIGLTGEAGATAGGDADQVPTSVISVSGAAEAPTTDSSLQSGATRSKGVESNGRINATPLARKVSLSAGVDLASIEGSGPRGRIKAIDVENVARTQSSAQGAPPMAALVLPVAPEGRRTPSIMQATMARRLSDVKHGVPHFYLAAEAEISALEELRATCNADVRRSKLTMTTFIVAASGRALADLPDANTVWADGELVTFHAADVGIAVNAPSGLCVPILRDAGHKSIDAIAAESRELVARAREGKLTRSDMAGGAFTVSNAGMYNVTYLTPIVNPGQSAILGVGSVRKVFRPDAEGRPALRVELGLVLSADHRVFDGVSGLELLNRIIGYLESPNRLLRVP